MNQALYLSKGIADYLITMRPSQFMVIMPPAPGTGSGRVLFSPLKAIKAEKSEQKRNLLDSETKREGEGVGEEGGGGGLLRLMLRLERQTHECTVALPYYAVPDPPGTFGGWGPADSSFSHEFFKGTCVQAGEVCLFVA